MIPLAEQKERLEESIGETADRIELWLHHLGSLDEIVKLAHKRLEQGHELYGSEMYEWDEETRLRNVLEELADAFVYMSSGPV